MWARFALPTLRPTPYALRAGTLRHFARRLSPQPGVSERNQLGEFLLLLGDTIRRSRFISGTGVSRGLFDQPGDILPYHRDALFKLVDRGIVVHRCDLCVG
jgi:hypothetical protein